MLKYIPASLYSEFEKRTSDYHSIFTPGDTLAYAWIYKNIHITKRFSLLKNDGMMLVIEGYLADWGGMRRWLLWNPGEGSDRADQIAHKVLSALGSEKQKVQRLTTLHLLDDMEQAKDDIREVFDSLCDLEIIHKKKTAKFGVVAAGKLMHMLFPTFCIMWDNEQVLSRKFGADYFSQDGAGYCAYLNFKTAELINVIKDFGRARNLHSVIRRIEKIHSKFLFGRGFGNVNEPITKLLDECNYP